MRLRCQAIASVPDPKDELAALVWRQAAADAFDQVERTLSQATRRGDLAIELLPAMVTRLPVDVLFSELALGSDVSRQQMVDIVDYLLPPLIRR